MRTALSRVLRSVGSASPAEEWTSARAALSEERRRVDRYLARTDSGPVYGFTTRLGQEDSLPLSVDGQQELLESHLIGPSTIAPADWRRLLVACKIEQCSHGESGIHPIAYKSLLDVLPLESPIRGNWLNSYSSGDVVAGAWLARDLRDNSPAVLDHPGDLITLINGNFVSTSMAIVATSSLIDAAGTLLAAWLPAVVQAGAPGTSPVIQPPVSLRDATPVQSAIRTATASIGAAIEHRLSGPSCNPRFTALDREIAATSQSSFLDFGLTFAMSNGIQLANVLAGLWQRLIQHRCDSDLATHKRIQSPKSAQGLLERMRGGAHTSHAFSGFDSEGIEDLRDLSLIHAHTLLEQCLLLREFESIWSDLGPIGDNGTPSADSRDLVGNLLDVERERVVPEAAALTRITALAPCLLGTGQP